MDVKAITRNVRISPIKLRLMVDLIRGKDASDALDILTNYNSKPARVIKKTVDSAISNAVNNNGLDADKLYIKFYFPVEPNPPSPRTVEESSPSSNSHAR